MADAPLIDTHIWIWWLEGSDDLRRIDREALDALGEGDRPKLSVISLWEVSLLVAKRRYVPGKNFEEWLRFAAGPATVSLVQIDAAIAKELLEIPRRFHADPADRILVATARVLVVPLLTYDDRIRKSGLVKPWK
jgi:PIN domain nuclease of toxin-antitoxin system